MTERHVKVLVENEEKREEVAGEKKSLSVEEVDDLADEEDYRFALSPLSLMKYLGDHYIGTTTSTSMMRASSKEDEEDDDDDDSHDIEKRCDKEEVILLEEK